MFEGPTEIWKKWRLFSDQNSVQPEIQILVGI